MSCFRIVSASKSATRSALVLAGITEIPSASTASVGCGHPAARHPHTPSKARGPCPTKHPSVGRDPCVPPPNAPPAKNNIIAKPVTDVTGRGDPHPPSLHHPPHCLLHKIRPPHWKIPVRRPYSYLLTLCTPVKKYRPSPSPNTPVNDSDRLQLRVLQYRGITLPCSSSRRSASSR